MLKLITLYSILQRLSFSRLLLLLMILSQHHHHLIFLMRYPVFCWFLFRFSFIIKLLLWFSRLIGSRHAHISSKKACFQFYSLYIHLFVWSDSYIHIYMYVFIYMRMYVANCTCQLVSMNFTASTRCLWTIERTTSDVPQ